jgi:hypothetical protein
MPFDPTLPVDHSQIVAAELRDQFNGLNDLITNSPSFDDVNNIITAQAAGNCNTVAALNLTVSNPPTQAQVQAIVTKLNELIAKLKRQ